MKINMKLNLTGISKKIYELAQLRNKTKKFRISKKLSKRIRKLNKKDKWLMELEEKIQNGFYKTEHD